MTGVRARQGFERADADGSGVRVVITHDFMETYGGAERVTQEMAATFPDAPVIAVLGRPLVARRMGIEQRFHSLLPARERLLRHYRLLTPAYPPLVDAARLPAADVLLSSSYAFAHRFRTANRAPQVCYCHSPLRFAWSMTESYRNEWKGAGRPFDLFAASMRRSDRGSADRVSHYLTQSPFTAAQIERFYGRRAEVIGAPVDCALFHPAAGAPDDYFLICGRLVEPYKRVSVAVEAFRDLPHRLVIAGDGPALDDLRAAAPANVEFVGHLADEELVPLMQRCQAAIFPSRDDFGLLPLEVMACGRPVIAYEGGGATETVVAGRTGSFFPDQSPESVRAAVASFVPEGFDARVIREHAEQWDRPVFRRRLVEAVERVRLDSEILGLRR